MIFKCIRYILTCLMPFFFVSFPANHCANEKCESAKPIVLEAIRKANQLWENYQRKGRCEQDSDCIVVDERDYNLCSTTYRASGCSLGVFRSSLVSKYLRERLSIHEDCKEKTKNCPRGTFPSFGITDCVYCKPKCIDYICKCGRDFP